MKRFIFLLLPLVAFTMDIYACSGKSGSVEKLVCLADSLKATLTTAQVTTLQSTYQYTSAQQWSNLPTTMVARLGIKLGSLTESQLAIVKVILREIAGSVSNEGYDEVIQLLLADDYLGANGGGASTYNAGNYYLYFNGSPTLNGLFEIKFGGHHLAIQQTYNNGVMVGATPHFEAIEPLSFTTNGKTYTPLGQEKAAFTAIMASLSATELASAKLSSTFSDILLGAKNNGSAKDWLFPATKLGLEVGTLSETKKALIIEAIKTYVLDADDTHSALILSQYIKEIDETYVAYSGTTSLETRNDYFRIDGPGVWIEISAQGGIVFSGIHYHSIWRDHKRDYGGSGSTGGVLTTEVGSDVSTAVVDLSLDEKPFRLRNAYPNPSIGDATFPYELNAAGHVTISMYGANSTIMETLVDDDMVAGRYELPLQKGQPQKVKGQYFILFTYTSNGKSSKEVRKFTVL